MLAKNLWKSKLELRNTGSESKKNFGKRFCPWLEAIANLTHLKSLFLKVQLRLNNFNCEAVKSAHVLVTVVGTHYLTSYLALD